MSNLSHVTSWKTTKVNLFPATSLPTAITDPELCRLLTFQMPTHKSLPLHAACTKVLPKSASISVFREIVTIRGKNRILIKHKEEDHAFSVVRSCLFNVFAANPHTGGRSSIRILRMRNDGVTGTHLSWCQLQM